jgi:pilus assembly protein CpaF
MIKLTITEKGGEPRSLSFDQNEVAIGRVQGNDIVLPKGNISKRHSKLTLVDGRMVIADAKSTNGTYVNGRKIGEPTAVRPGDKIFVGDFLIVIDPSAAAAETSSSGSRRGGPPPPPPPRLRPASGRSILEGEAYDSDESMAESDELAERPPLSAGRGRPPAPPPPPPRRTIVMPSLQDDSVDIGLDEPPPSPADVGLGMGAGMTTDAGGDAGGYMAGHNPLADLSNDAEDVGFGDSGRDAGSDVFGSRPATDEDAAPAPGAPAAPAGHPFSAKATLGDDAAGYTAAPGSASRPAAPPATSEGFGADGAITLEGLLADPSVTAILVAAGGLMQIERGGKLETVDPPPDGNAVAESVWQISNMAVPPPPSDNPVVDVRLFDGTRVTALFPPIASASVCAAIRKSTVTDVPLGDVAGSGDVEKVLRGALQSRRNLLLAGDVATLSTVLGALAGAISPGRRIVGIGTGIKSRPGWMELGMASDPAGLVRASVAFRADHLIVASAGGAELPELLFAAARGQEGVIACIAARSAAEALERLRAFSATALGATGFTSLVQSTVDLIVVAGTTSAGGVRILEIAEPIAEGQALVPWFVARRPESDRSATALEVSGVSARLAAAIAISPDADPLAAHLVRR